MANNEQSNLDVFLTNQFSNFQSDTNTFNYEWVSIFKNFVSFADSKRTRSVDDPRSFASRQLFPRSIGIPEFPADSQREFGGLQGSEIVRPQSGIPL